MRIDSHHSFTERYPLDHLGSILARNRFEGSVLVGAVPEQIPDFVRGLVVPLEAVGRYRDHPKFRGAFHEFSGSIPEGLNELAGLDIPLDALGGLPLIPRIRERFPKLRIVIDHAGSPWTAEFGAWARDLAEAARLPDVFCKLSALTRVAPAARPYVQHALAVFGPGRLMFGSDWPAALPEYTWKSSLAAFTQALGAQTIEVREQLLGGTAERVYAL